MGTPIYGDDDLDSAVEAGAISAESAEAFRRHVAASRDTPAVDEEYFRLVSGFNDIFVVIASTLLLIALGWIGNSLASPLGYLLAAAAAWGLAEYFVLKRHMALPAIVLLLAFVGGVFLFFETLLPVNLDPLAAGLAAVAAFVHWRRFRVPITVAAGAAAVVFAVLDGLSQLSHWLSPIMFGAGLCVFLLALRWDASDPERRTRRSDVAFWLHLLAAPLLVHPVFWSMHLLTERPTFLDAAIVLVLYSAIALVSLWIDRRALMASALGYVLYTFSKLLKHSGLISLDFAVAALVVGSALLFLSAFWQQGRAAVLSWLPGALRTHLPPSGPGRAQRQ